MAETHKGACFCGAVEIEVKGQAALMGYCHCTDCAQWGAAPINAFTLWAPDAVRVTKGKDQLASYNKTENSYRKFCKKCGGHLMTEHPGMNKIDVYAPVLRNFTHKPSMHIHYASKMVSVKDGLPKFKDVPAEFGGSGATLPD